jgi:putative flippase GtrA
VNPQTTRRQFAVFALTGVLGFLIDVSVLYVLMWLGLNFLSARFGSFLCAVTTTWLINRLKTFRTAQRPSAREFIRYLAAMSVGGVVNYAASYAAIKTLPEQSLRGVIAVAVGSLLGLTLNFAASKFWVFSHGRE